MPGEVAESRQETPAIDTVKPDLKSDATAQPFAASANGKQADSSHAVSTSVEEDLYRAFVEGLGIELRNRTALDRDFMKMLGQMLCAYTQGIVDMNADRTAVKKTIHAHVTVIEPKYNNPLKFSPTGQVALTYLLERPIVGFMGSLEAIKNIMSDLRAHQIGIVSGMQSALSHLLDRFDPATISNSKKTKGLADKIPVLRSSRLWEAYVRYYFKTVQEYAQGMDMGGVQDIFGSAFLEAYRAAISTLNER